MLSIHFVSIHAPAWGATQGGSMSGSKALFQSTPPRGGRRPFRKSSPVKKSFNPRPRVGGDMDVRIDIKGVDGFNPRPRVGGDG